MKLKLFKFLLYTIPVYLMITGMVYAQVTIPNVGINIGGSNTPEGVSQGIQLLILLTVLTLAPSILIITTSFTRIVIVLSLVRQAIGTPQLPPNQIIISLAMVLTLFVMTPTLNEINTTAMQPYLKKEMTQDEAFKKAALPMRNFMFKHASESDLALFIKLAKIKAPKTRADVPTYALIPAFIISELKTAFKIGFLIFLPFLIIDVVVSSILISMGMMFLPPITISLPFKIVLFVLVDGWHIISEKLVSGFLI